MIKVLSKPLAISFILSASTAPMQASAEWYDDIDINKVLIAPGYSEVASNTVHDYIYMDPINAQYIKEQIREYESYYEDGAKEDDLDYTYAYCSDVTSDRGFWIGDKSHIAVPFSITLPYTVSWNIAVEMFDIGNWAYVRGFWVKDSDGNHYFYTSVENYSRLDLQCRGYKAIPSMKRGGGWHKFIFSKETLRPFYNVKHG